METQEKELSNVSDEDFANLDSSSDSSEDEIEEDSSDNESEQSLQDSKGKKKNQKKSAKKPKKVPKTRIIFNVSDTQYDVVKYVGKKVFGWKLSFDKESMDWDVFWTDWAVQPETLAKMQTFQKINHFPGMYSLARKNHLGRNLMRMKKSFPDTYKFFPQTFLLPTEYNDFRSQFNSKKNNKTFIVKPEASCQGRGIFLTKTYESVQLGEHYVVQRYLQKPYLIDGLKFDMRIYVLLAGCDPLKVFLYDDGLGRFATETYVAPTDDNLDNVCMHLTNYAINKDNPNFVFNESSNADDVGHKRSLKAVLRTLKEQGHDVDKLWKEIKKIIIKTFCSVQPILAHSYRSCHPDEPYNNMCFELLGFDIMLDHKLKPWLLEVNHTPSFTTDTPLDKSIKKSAIRDALKIMNISVENKIKSKNKKRVELQQRVLTGKKVKMTTEEKQAEREKAQKEREEWEAKNCGRYEKIYPFDDPSQAEEDYEEYMKVANKWFEEWTGLSIKRNTKKVSDPNKPPPMIFGQSSSVVIARAKEIHNQVLNAQKAKPNQKPGGPNGTLNPGNSNEVTALENRVDTENENLAKAGNYEGYEFMDVAKDLDEENKDFMEHVAAVTGKEALDVMGEDQEEMREAGGKGPLGSNRALRAQPKTINALGKIEEKPEGKNGDLDINNRGDFSSSTTTVNGSGSTAESRMSGPKNTAFRIKTLHPSKDSSQKTIVEQASLSEDQKFSINKKFSQFMNAEQGEEVQNTVIRSGNRVYHEPRKVPLKLATGIVGDFGSGIHQVWSGPEPTLPDLDKEQRGPSNLLLGKVIGRQEYHGKYVAKKAGSPIYHQPRIPGNYLAPKLFELNVNTNFKEEVQARPALNNVPGLSLQGFGGPTKGSGKTVQNYQKDPLYNLSNFNDPQAAIQRYYNYLMKK